MKGDATEPAGVSHLDTALAALDEVSGVAAEDRDTFVKSVDLQRAAAYLWIVIGSALKEYCRARGIARDSSAFSEPIGMRHKLAYGPHHRLDPSILWHSCLHDAPALRAEILAIRGALSGE